MENALIDELKRDLARYWRIMDKPLSERAPYAAGIAKLEARIAELRLAIGMDADSFCLRADDCLRPLLGYPQAPPVTFERAGVRLDHAGDGLPDASDVQQDDALEKAKQVLKEEYGLDKKTFDLYSVIYPYYDVTNPDAPLWKFVFCPTSFQDMDIRMLYRVELNARTGELIMKNAFQWQRLSEDLEYDLKLY